MAINNALKRNLALAALRAALRIRVERNISLVVPINIFDFVSSGEIEITFVDIPSLEAMYIKAEVSRILISSHRPFGRQAFSCAHEYGHHVHDHGTRLDELVSGNDDRSDPDEYLADRFASYLLMPKSLVNNAFRTRGWDSRGVDPVQIFTIANWIGVGYSTLLYQMYFGLNLIGQEKYRELLAAKPKAIRKEILGFDTSSNAVVVDEFWDSISVNIQVGDFILGPGFTGIEGNAIEVVNNDGRITLCKAKAPGICKLSRRGNLTDVYVRIAKRGFIGRNIFRYEADPEYEAN